MKNSRYELLSVFLRFSLEFVFYAGFAVTVALPFIFHYFPRILYEYFWFLNEGRLSKSYFIIMFIELFGVAALIIVRQLVLIFKSVNEDKPFIRQNASRLRIIAVCCFAVFVLFLFKTILFFTALSLLMTAALLIASIAALVFSRLFYLAVEYKSENDLTI